MPVHSLVSITIYPIKSLDGHDVSHATLIPAAGLAEDRRWRLVDMEGRVVNAKRTPLIQAIRTEFVLDERLVTLATGDLHAETFPLQPGRHGPCGWLSEVLGMPVLLEERAAGFPDDCDAPGPTLITTASLACVATWFGFGLEEARRRFRMNLEIDCRGAPDDGSAFWEDTLASPADDARLSELRLPTVQMGQVAVDPYADLPPPEPRQFTIGTAMLRATGVCRRCVVPTRDSMSGEPELGFRDVFEARRRQAMRRDVASGSWGSGYRLGVNTQVISSHAATISLGDTLQTRSLHQGD